MRKIVEQHITNTAAENNAERDPDDEVVEIGHGERGRAAPQLLRRNNRARIIPAADNADDIGERVPAHRKRADRNQDWIDRGKRNDRENQHQLFLDLDFLTRAAAALLRSFIRSGSKLIIYASRVAAKIARRAGEGRRAYRQYGRALRCSSLMIG